MKTLFLLIIGFCLFCACSKKGQAPIPRPPYTGIVGQWKWVNAYKVSFEPGVLIFLDKGTITFTNNNTFSRLKSNGVADSGTYSLFTSIIPGLDSLHFYRNTAPSPFQILDSTYDYYTVNGDTLRLGAVSTSVFTSTYGSVDVYVKQ